MEGDTGLNPVPGGSNLSGAVMRGYLVSSAFSVLPATARRIERLVAGLGDLLGDLGVLRLGRGRDGLLDRLEGLILGVPALVRPVDVSVGASWVVQGPVTS